MKLNRTTTYTSIETTILPIALIVELSLTE